MIEDSSLPDSDSSDLEELKTVDLNMHCRYVVHDRILKALFGVITPKLFKKNLNPTINL